MQVRKSLSVYSCMHVCVCMNVYVRHCLCAGIYIQTKACVRVCVYMC